MNYWKNVDWKNVLERALWTFAEGFLVALPVTISINMSGATWKTAIFSALMSGVSAVKTLAIDLIKQHNAQYEAKQIEPDEYGDLAEYFEEKDSEEKEEK